MSLQRYWTVNFCARWRGKGILAYLESIRQRQPDIDSSCVVSNNPTRQEREWLAHFQPGAGVWCGNVVDFLFSTVGLGRCSFRIIICVGRTHRDLQPWLILSKPTQVGVVSGYRTRSVRSSPTLEPTDIPGDNMAWFFQRRKQENNEYMSYDRRIRVRCVHTSLF